MTILIILVISALAVSAAVGAIVVAGRDGYRRVPRRNMREAAR
ncbi:hypothetical protein BJ978_002006 [Agromyces terreus]|uniref:Uncharacterized protein n=1 Tax=Agromyces terreus TaxID=424795 RepID=A0A9X2H287_9MICO|nr:hypothetical protein [Agromyces terreus]MCP2371330.1 hypothetical protein [Agromyces terreus]